MIGVLVVDDSKAVLEFLVHVLDADPALRVVGTASDGESALAAVGSKRPDVVTMDMHMPGVDGVEATRRIMETHPTPIVVVTGSTDSDEVATTFHAIEAGALAVIGRPAGIGHPDHETTVRELVETVKLMSEVKVVRRWPRARRGAAVTAPAALQIRRTPARIQAVALGASTGGPPVLQTILSALPADFAAPVLIVQHMASGFIRGFGEWLATSSRLPVRLAAHGEVLLPGHVYLAPDDFQMRVAPGGTIVLARDEPENGLRPAASCLFRSLAEVWGGDVAAGLLTGMGRDGAGELALLKSLGAVTFAQDKGSSVVHGMPGEAIRLGAATYVLAPAQIAAALVSLTNSSHQGDR